MDRDIKIAWRWWLIAVLALLVIRMLQGCTPIQSAPGPIQADTVVVFAPFRLILVDSLTGGNQGLTECDPAGRTVVKILRSVSDQLSYPELLAHEEQHVEGMARWMLARHASCRDYMDIYVRDSAFRLTVESEAYCRGLKVATALYGGRWEDGVPQVVHFLSVGYQLYLPDSIITEAVERACRSP